jgi:hypothetical protein
LTYNSPEIYTFYQAKGGELSYSEWSSIVQEFNEMAMNEIILKGGKLNLGANLSTLSIGRIKRNYHNQQVNWAESNKLKEQLLEEGKQLYDKETGKGEKWIVYFTNDWYCRFYWNKGNCKIPNKSVYRFVATRGKMGNKTKLKNLLRSDDLSYLSFRKLEE